MNRIATIAPPRMDADAFTAWSDAQSEVERFELYNGVVVAMPTEGFLHGEIKAMITSRFVVAVETSCLDAQVFTGEMDVRVGSDQVFKPDVVVRLGKRLPADGYLLRDPFIVVEVLSRSTRARDVSIKQDAYLAIPTLHHYLLVDPEARRITQHRRSDDGSFAMTVHGDGPLTLDPPGITIDRLFP